MTGTTISAAGCGIGKTDHRSKSSFFGLRMARVLSIFARKQKQHGRHSGPPSGTSSEVFSPAYSRSFLRSEPSSTSSLIAIGFIAFFTWMWYQNKYKSAPEQMD